MSGDANTAALTADEIAEAMGEGEEIPKSEGEVCSVGGNGDGGDDGFNGPEPPKCFISIEGIKTSDLEQKDREKIEKELVTILLTAGYPISDVNVASEDAPIVEIRNKN